MDFEHNMRIGMTVEQLEEVVRQANIDEDQRLELAKFETAKTGETAKQRWLDEVREKYETFTELQEEEEQKIIDQMAEKEMLINASPELINAVSNIKILESQLADAEWQNKRLTALVSQLELKIRDLTKK
jgi:hypothetical protein